MTTPQDTLQTAFGHHQAGRLQEAAQLYRQLLADNPRHADALHLLGVVMHQTGDIPHALQLIKSAIAVDSSRPLYHYNLGEVCSAAKDFEEAKAAYSKAVELEPGAAGAWFGLALANYSQGDASETIAHCRRALALLPNMAEAQRLLAMGLVASRDFAAADVCYQQLLQLTPNDGTALWQWGTLACEMGNFDRARGCHQRAIALQPRMAELNLGLGDVEATAGEWAAAIAAYQTALVLNPDLASAHKQLGAAYQATGQFEAAIEHYRRAIALAPNVAAVHYNVGTALGSLGRRDEAANCYRAALRIDPRYVDALVNLGGYYQKLPDAAQALACYERALAIKPDDAKAHFNRSLIWLGEGKLAEGWPEYEWRQKVAKFPVHSFDVPQWNGTPLPDKTLLVHAEQGLGDTIQFVRYLPQVRERCGRAMFMVHPALVEFFKQAGIADVFDDERRPPPADFHVPLMSLPRTFQSTLDTIPSATAYLTIEPVLVDEWRTRLTRIDGFRVGICWQGSPTLESDHLRSFPLSSLAPLANVPGVRLLSLQKVNGLEQLAALDGRFDVVDLRPEYDEERGAFLNAAAVIKNLDLVVTADTAIAHLAAALGAPVWIALPMRADWRWLQDRSDTPWYPTVRLFRQAKSGDWAELFARMAAELRREVDRSQT